MNSHKESFLAEKTLVATSLEMTVDGQNRRFDFEPLLCEAGKVYRVDVDLEAGVATIAETKPGELGGIFISTDADFAQANPADDFVFDPGTLKF